MATIHRPRRGSLAFSPRKRAKSQVPRTRYWAAGEEKARMDGFAGYKAGMTHLIMIDDKPNSLTEGMEVSVPVTILETPPLSIAALRVYEKYNGGVRAAGEAWSEKLDPYLARSITVPKNKRGTPLDDIGAQIDKMTELRLIAYTNPKLLTGVPKKNPDLMEIQVNGSNIADQFELAKGLLGSSVPISSVFGTGSIIDVTAITKGKGTQGPVKRWGINLQKRKHSRGGKRRHIGNLGPWNPHHVRWTVPLLGQMGYHQRTEYNKRVLAMGSDGGEITPEGGFPGYGIVRGEYAIISGSVPGPTKRLVRMRNAVRPKDGTAKMPQVLYVSTDSKQGL
ncbi:MAG TPA: 50S ribosomal protein L3 [Methanothrix sp.]|nr:50S ribosomal protein L3 [Methanothrix sp.]